MIIFKISDFPCHEAKPFNCGRKCGRPLKCGHHLCDKECHEIPANEISDTKKVTKKFYPTPFKNMK